MRPATEEFNLAGNHHRQDVTASEFIRTFRTQSFLGGALLRRLKFESEAQLQERKQVSKVPVRRSSTRQRSSFSVPFEEVYGFRGRDASLYYLSPWEFTKWWSVEYLKPPSAYERKFDEPKTSWVEGGLEHWRRTLKDPNLPGVEPGKHYVVLEPCALPAAYVTFPDDEATQELRHRAVLVRNARLLVPQPEGTPMPTQRFSAEERGRMLSVYLRPWVLHRRYASPHVPHIADLDICVCVCVCVVVARGAFAQEPHVDEDLQCHCTRQRFRECVARLQKRTCGVRACGTHHPQLSCDSISRIRRSRCSRGRKR